MITVASKYALQFLRSLEGQLYVGTYDKFVFYTHADQSDISKVNNCEMENMRNLTASTSV